MRFFLTLCLAALPGWAQDPPSWLEDPMNTPTDQLWSGMESLAPTNAKGEAIDAFLVRVVFTVDDQQLCKTETTRVYRILNRDGESVDQISQSWRSWYQNRPQIRARVINGADEEATLDERDLIERSAETSSDIFSDDRILVGPLPHVRQGSLVVVQVLETEHQPYFEGGAAKSDISSGYRWIEYSLVTPKGIKPHIVTNLLQKDATRNTVDNGRIVSYQLYGYDWSRLDTLEFDDPDLANAYPSFQFSTVPSWNLLAEAYHRHVEEMLASGGQLQPPAEQLVEGDGRATAIRLSNWLNQRVRYTGMELGKKALIPYEPAEIIRRGYGDCKDKALILVAMLRQAGIQASLALVGTGVFAPLAELPSMRNFNHAIVYLPDLDFWIDPTWELQASGYLPEEDADIPALIAAPTTTRLVRTPAYNSKDHADLLVRTFDLRDFMTVRETVCRQARGYREDQWRRQYSGSNATEFEQNTRATLPHLTQWALSDTQDPTQPFRLSNETEKVYLAEEPALLLQLTLDGDILVHELAQDIDLQAESRHGRFSLPAYQREQTTVVLLPPQFAVKEAIDDLALELGVFQLIRTVQKEPGKLTITYRAWPSKSLITPDEYLATAHALAQANLQLELSFEADYLRLAEAGKDLEAIDALRTRLADPDNAAWAAIQLACIYAKLEQWPLAQTQLDSALTATPDNPGLLLARIFLAQKRRDQGTWPRATCLEDCRRLLERRPDDAALLNLYATALEYNAQGRRYQRDSDLEQALLTRAKVNDPEQLGLHMELLLHLGRFEEMIKQSKNDPESSLWQVIGLAGSGQHQAVGMQLQRCASQLERLQLLQQGFAKLTFHGFQTQAMTLLEHSPVENKEVREHFQKALTPAPDEPPQRALARTWVRYLWFAEDRPLETFVLPSSLTSAAKAFEEVRKHGMALSTELLGDAVGPSMWWPSWANSTWEEAGNPELGYRLTAHVSFGLPGAGPSVILYLAPHDGKLWLVGSQETLPLIGAYILRLLEQGQDEAAYQWLDWANEGQSLLEGDTFWETVTHDREMARWAALILVSEDHDNVAVLDELEAFLPKLDGPQRYQLTKVLLDAKLPESRIGPIVEDLYRVQPNNARAQYMYCRHLLHLGDFATLEREAKNWGLVGEAELNELLLGRDGYAGMARHVAELERLGKATPAHYNNLAWETLWEPAPPADLENILAKLSLNEHAEAHTFATLRAEQGKLLQAIAQLKVSKGPRWKPEPVDQLVLGKIAEKLGARESAIAHYRKVETEWTDGHHSAYALAQKWTAALENPAPGPSDETPAAK